MAAVAVRVKASVLIFCLLWLQPKPVGYSFTASGERTMVLGSRPPACVNKCLSCRPCMATLVIPPHQRSRATEGEDDDGYYLLSWKCRCGNRLFNP